MNKIVIFSSARSGGNLLDGMFSKYNGARSFGELFSRRRHNQSSSFLFEMDNVYEITNQDILNKLEEVYGNDIDTMICRHHEAHCRYSYNQSIYEDVIPFKKVLLYRENFLNKVVSLSIASTRGKWHYNEDENLPEYSDYRIHFGKDYLDKFIERTKRYYNNILSRYEDVVVLKYEDLLKMDNLNFIMNKFGFDNTLEDIPIETVHINKKDDGYTRIVNIDELPEYKLILENGRFK